MRVLHVIPAVAARYGGPGIVALETVRALRAAGVDALVATTDADGQERLAVETGRIVEWQGIPVVVQPLGGEDRFKWSGALGRWLRAHVGEFDLVDIHAVFSHSSVAAGRACRRARVPYVVRPHGSLDPWSLARKPWQKRALFWFGGRALLSGAAFLQYTAPAEQAAAERALPWLPPGRIVPLGVDDRCFAEPTTGTTHPYVLTLSRLDAKKSLELLIEAFHDVAVGPLASWRLVLAGDGRADYVHLLRRRAASGAAADRISFPGWVTGDTKRALLSGAALFASPSTQENFGLSIVEAMATGVPVLVTSGVNLSPEIEQARAGWIVERTREAMATALGAILGDGQTRHTRGQAARQLADRFRWDRSAAALRDVYAEVLTTRRGTLHA